MPRAIPPHPHVMLARLLAQNRWHTRRVLWPQTLVFAVLATVLGAAGLALVRQQGAGLLAGMAGVVHRHDVAVSIGLMLMVTMSVTVQLRTQERQYVDGAFVDLPVLPVSRRAWLNGLAFRYVVGWLIGLSTLLGLMWWVAGFGSSGQPAQASPITAAQAVSLLLSVLGGGVIARWLAERPVDRTVIRNQSERVPGRLWHWFSSADLPHVPAWLAQASRTRWVRGRAPAGLLVLLMIAPSEAIAILVPILGMAAWVFLNRIDLAHRGIVNLEAMLGVAAPSGQRWVRAILPVSMLFALLLAAWLCCVSRAAGVPWPTVLTIVLIVVAWVMADLLLAVRCRASAKVQRRARFMLSAAILYAATEAPPLLLLLPLIGGWWWRSLRS